MPRSRTLAALTGLALTAGSLGVVTFAPSAFANPDGTDLVISEVYGGGGNSGATLRNDFIELYNPTAAAISVDGMSVQYRSSSGSGTGFTNLAGSVPPGRHYLIQEAAGTGGTADLPAPDATGTLAMSGTAGSVALVDGTGTVTPAAANTVDLVGYGGATTLREGNPAPGLSNTTSASRNLERTDTDDNATDFSAGDPDPQNSASQWPPDEEPDVTVVDATIAEIQGTGFQSPYAGIENTYVRTRGVVTAAYPTGDYFAFVIQTEGTGSGDDATPGASDGLWVYQADDGVDASIGQFVEVTGPVVERFGRTELTYDPNDTSSALTVLTETPDPVTARAGDLPATAEEREAHESQLLDVSGQQFTVTDNFNTNRFGEIGLATGTTPLIVPTEVADAQDTAAIEAVQDDNYARGVVLDDGADWDYARDQNHMDDPMPWLRKDNPVRVGAPASVVGDVVLDYGFGDWRFQPVSQVTTAGTDVLVVANDRAQDLAPRDVGGDLQIATANVLNYFNTTGTEFVAAGGTCTYFVDRVGDPVSNDRCDPNGPRGAAEDEDLARQQEKIVAEINTLDADIVSLEEVENSVKLLGETDRDDALRELVDALNVAAGSQRWAFVPSPPASELPPLERQDVIRLAFIYQPATVEPVGASDVLVDDASFTNARQPLAQAFKPRGGESDSTFGVIANHFKSKGSACTGEPEGLQGNCNETRVRDANALVDFAEQFKTDRGIAKLFLAGDFNSYSMEDPIQVLEAAGYTVLHSDTPAEWSYSFGGQSGSLDHVLANEAALPDVTGVDIWEINANEAVAFEYSRHNLNVVDLYEAGVFRAADHNPEIVGIDVPAPREKVEMDIDLDPRKVEAGKTRPRLEVEVVDDDNRRQDVSGVVRVSYEDEVRTETLQRGKALFELGTFDTPGEVTVTVEYLGSDTHAPLTETFTFEVRPRRR